MSSLQLDEEMLESQRDRILFSPDPELEPLTPGLSKHKHPRRVFGYIPLMILYIISIVMTATATLDVVYYLVCFSEGVETAHCLTSEVVGEKVASYMSYSSILCGTVRVFVGTIMSRWSDRIGRKPVLILCFSVSVVAKSLEYFMVFGKAEPVYYMWLLLPSIIAELGGSVSYMSAASVSYVSDLVEDSVNRTKLVAMLEGSFFAALAFSPTLGSIVLRNVGLQNLYFVSLCLSVLVVILVAAFMKESLHEKLQTSNKAVQKQQTGTLNTLKPLLFHNVKDPLARRNARIFLVCSLLGTEFAMSFLPIVLLYPKRLFQWSAVEMGYLITSMSSTRTLMFVVAFPFLYTQVRKLVTVHQAQIDRADVILLRLNMILTFAGYFLMGRSTTAPHFVASAILDASSSIGGPALKGGFLKHVPQGQFGTFMGAYQLLTNMFLVVTPSLFLQIYHWAYERRPSLPFELVSLLFLGLLAISFLLKPVR